MGRVSSWPFPWQTLCWAFPLASGGLTWDHPTGSAPRPSSGRPSLALAPLEKASKAVMPTVLDIYCEFTSGAPLLLEPVSSERAEDRHLSCSLLCLQCPAARRRCSVNTQWLNRTGVVGSSTLRKGGWISGQGGSRKLKAFGLGGECTRPAVP